MVKQFKNAIKIDVFDKHLHRHCYITLLIVLGAMQPTRWTTTYSIGSFNSLSTYTNGLMVDIPHMFSFVVGCAMQPTRWAKTEQHRLKSIRKQWLYDFGVKKQVGWVENGTLTIAILVTFHQKCRVLAPRWQRESNSRMDHLWTIPHIVFSVYKSQWTYSYGKVKIVNL